MFSEADLEKMKEAVGAAEKLTSGEIVPVIAVQSDAYSDIRHWLAVMCLVLSSAGMYLLRHRYPFLFEIEVILFFQGVALFFGTSIGKIPLVIRFFAPKSKMQKAVHERAMIEFMQLGLQETKHRTGVLLYVSLLEHRVEILADKGIHQKLGDGFWKGEVEKLALGIRSGKSGDSISATILTIGKKLQEFFPRGDDDKNELDDSVRTR